MIRTDIGKTGKIARIILALAIAAIEIYLKTWWPLVVLGPLMMWAIYITHYLKRMGLNTYSQKNVQ